MSRFAIVQSKNDGTSAKMLDGIYSISSDVDELVKRLNASVNKNEDLKYTKVQLFKDEETKCECDMSEEELQEYRQAIMDIDKDLKDGISFDEWSAREFGELSVDYYYTAVRLYNMGYRKIERGQKND